MALDFVSTAMDMAAVILAVVILIRILPTIGIGERAMPGTLFFFAMVSVLFAYIYWFTYTLMRPDARMPLAANEIGEIAVFLLLSAMLGVVFHDWKRSAKLEVLFVALFVAASIALWIAWTGEWFQDIIGGLAFGYYLCACARSLKQTDTMKRSEWLTLGVMLCVILLEHSVMFFLPETTYKMMEYLCYATMFLVLLYLMVKSIRSAIQSTDISGNLALACAAYGFSLSTMYMSEGWFYSAAMLCSLVSLVLMAIAVKKGAGV